MSQFNIQVQTTNNENIVKFIANSFLTNANSYEFNNIDEAKPSPIAQQLFYLPFVKTVYISQNFIAIEKYNIVTWEDVQQEVADSIASYLNDGMAVIDEALTTKKVPVTVYAEITPNPSVMKFVANKPLVDGTFEFKTIDDTKNAPLPMALFNFPFVKEVFLSANYISIMKYDIAEWQEISMEIREFIRSYIEQNKPLLNDAFLNEAPKEEQVKSHVSNSSEIDQQIIAILDEYVKPAVAGDGGHIAYQGYAKDTKTVSVLLQGACSGCPSSTITLKNGIETMLKEMLPGKVSSVIAING